VRPFLFRLIPDDLVMMMMIMDRIPNRCLAVLPMIVPLYLWCQLIGNPIPLLEQWKTGLFHNHHNNNNSSSSSDDNDDVVVQQQLIAYMVMAVVGYVTTQQLIPHIQQYTLRKNICGKDLGKRGTATADVPMYVWIVLCCVRIFLLLEVVVHCVG
jgi:hypothetical protein